MSKTFIVVAITLALGTGSVNAQSNRGSMGMDHSMPGMTDNKMKGMGSHNKMAMEEFMSAMKKMDSAMMSAKGSTTDVAFARKMLAHHQGAIDMAQIELKHGMDPDMKRIAQQTIAEQTKGKAELETWLKSHGG